MPQTLRPYQFGEIHHELEIDFNRQECRLRIWKGPVSTTAYILLQEGGPDDRPEECNEQDWEIAQTQIQKWNEQPF